MNTSHVSSYCAPNDLIFPVMRLEFFYSSVFLSARYRKIELTQTQAAKQLKINNNKGTGNEHFLVLHIGAACLICVWEEMRMLPYVAVWRNTCWIVSSKESVWKAGGNRQFVVSIGRTRKYGFCQKNSQSLRFEAFSRLTIYQSFSGSKSMLIHTSITVHNLACTLTLLVSLLCPMLTSTFRPQLTKLLRKAELSAPFSSEVLWETKMSSFPTGQKS